MDVDAATNSEENVGSMSERNGGIVDDNTESSAATCFNVRVSLHRGCGWPEDATLSERQSWSLELSVGTAKGPT